MSRFGEADAITPESVVCSEADLGAGGAPPNNLAITNAVILDVQ